MRYCLGFVICMFASGCLGIWDKETPTPSPKPPSSPLVNAIQEIRAAALQASATQAALDELAEELREKRIGGTGGK